MDVNIEVLGVAVTGGIWVGEDVAMGDDEAVTVGVDVYVGVTVGGGSTVKLLSDTSEMEPTPVS
jgi:hypothetical protein